MATTNIPALSTSPDSATSVESIEIGDYLFCRVHGDEVCKECGTDTREDNDFTAGVDFLDRSPIHVDFVINTKDNSPQCKKHHNNNCSNCFGFKKQINKLHRDAKSSNKKNKGNKDTIFQ